MHPYHNVAIAGIYNTVQARRIDETDKEGISLLGAIGAMRDAAVDPHEIDAVIGETARELIASLRLGPCLRVESRHGIADVLQAADMIASGRADVVLVAAGNAGEYLAGQGATAPWTRPAHEFVVGYGMFTAAEFALMARRHMECYGTTREQMATAAATIRNNGHINPEAWYFEKGPYTETDIINSRKIAEPFCLLDCAMTSEGGCAIVLTSADRALDCPNRPVWILGGEGDCYGPAYQAAPLWDLTGRSEISAGWVGRRAAQVSFKRAGLTPKDVSVCELYDPFSFEIIRQLEAFGFCDEGEGGQFVESGKIGLEGSLPVTTDGGTMSFSHPGGNTQQLQRVTRGVQQLRGSCASAQLTNPEVALCSNGGSAALFTEVMLLGVERP